MSEEMQELFERVAEACVAASIVLKRHLKPFAKLLHRFAKPLRNCGYVSSIAIRTVALYSLPYIISARKSEKRICVVSCVGFEWR